MRSYSNRHRTTRRSQARSPLSRTTLSVLTYLTQAPRGIQVGRFDDDGLLVERWGATDEAGLMQQLGLA